jgi:hypothetical protein
MILNPPQPANYLQFVMTKQPLAGAQRLYQQKWSRELWVAYPIRARRAIGLSTYVNDCQLKQAACPHRPQRTTGLQGWLTAAH